jgi:hypothetical protein
MDMITILLEVQLSLCKETEAQGLVPAGLQVQCTCILIPWPIPSLSMLDAEKLERGPGNKATCTCTCRWDIML